MSEFNSRRTPRSDFPDYDDRRASPPIRTNNRRQPSPAYGYGDADRLTPPNRFPPTAKKTQFSNDGPQSDRPPMSDEQPYKVFRTESPNPPTRNSFVPSTRGTAEMYFIDSQRPKNMDDDDGGYSDRRSPPIPSRNNAVSPAPYRQPDGVGPEMYHIGDIKENIPNHDGPSPFDNTGHSKSVFNSIGGASDQEAPGKVTVYVLSSSDDNQRVASPVGHRTALVLLNLLSLKYVFFFRVGSIIQEAVTLLVTNRR